MKSAAPVRAPPPAWTFRNTNRVNRIRHHLRLYAQIILSSLGRVPVKELIRTQFPFWMRDSPTPPMLSVELTNRCNLRCGYCTNPTTLRPRGMMSEATFCRLVEEVREAGVYRVALCGNGEPTLHPRFADYIGRLSAAAPWVSLTTNGQCISDDIAIATLHSARQINVTVDGASKVAYEERRVGGSFERLLENLRRLLVLKRSIGSLALINVRVMLGRSDRQLEEEILRFWRPYADVVSKQYILDFGGGKARGFTPVSKGRCTLPFKKLDVHWNGVVNLCGYSWIQTGHPEGVVLGNISDTTFSEMWNSSLMRQYREGHRRGMEVMIPICRGCPGRT